MAERRVMTNPGAARGISRPASMPPAPAPATEPEPPQRRRTGWLVATIVVLTAALLGGGGYVALASGLFGSDGEPETTLESGATEVEPGEVIPVETMTVNLADGRYLRLAFSVQLSQDSEAVEVAQLQDVAIEVFTGRDMAEIQVEETRNELKETLTERLNETTDGEVIDVYLTDYVTQ